MTVTTFMIIIYLAAVFSPIWFLYRGFPERKEGEVTGISAIDSKIRDIREYIERRYYLRKARQQQSMYSDWF